MRNECIKGDRREVETIDSSTFKVYWATLVIIF